MQMRNKNLLSFCMVKVEHPELSCSVYSTFSSPTDQTNKQTLYSLRQALFEKIFYPYK